MFARLNATSLTFRRLQIRLAMRFADSTSRHHAPKQSAKLVRSNTDDEVLMTRSAGA
jgi:hypothetical protein